MGNIFLVGEKSNRTFVLTNPAVLLSDNVFQYNCNLQHMSNINIHFGQHFFKNSSNFCLWLDMDTIGYCSSSQSVLSLQQFTWLPFPSCQALSSSSYQGQSGQPPWRYWPAAGWGWQGVGRRPWTWGSPRSRSWGGNEEYSIFTEGHSKFNRQFDSF